MDECSAWCCLLASFAHRQAAGVQRDDFVVEARPTGLVLGDELGLEAAMAVAGHLDGQFAEIALEGLLALAVAGVAAGVGHSLLGRSGAGLLTALDASCMDVKKAVRRWFFQSAIGHSSRARPEVNRLLSA